MPVRIRDKFTAWQPNIDTDYCYTEMQGQLVSAISLQGFFRRDLWSITFCNLPRITITYVPQQIVLSLIQVMFLACSTPDQAGLVFSCGLCDLVSVKFLNKICQFSFKKSTLKILRTKYPPSYSGPWFNIKMSSCRYRKSHCGDKTILRPSYLHNGISYTGKMTSLYWIGPQVSTC